VRCFQRESSYDVRNYYNYANSIYVGDLLLLMFHRGQVKNFDILLNAAFGQYVIEQTAVGNTTWQLFYVVCLKSSVNGTRKQTKQKIQSN
jgi:hypothetical protein